MSGVWNIISRIAQETANLVVPRVCIDCGCILNKHEKGICRSCIDQLPSTYYELMPDNRITEAMYGRMTLQSAFAGYYFKRGNIIQHLVHDFKYHRNVDVAIGIGRELGLRAKASHFIDDYDYLIPVPLHEHKKEIRGYNQAYLIAKGMAETTDKEVREDVLLRNVFSKSQTTKSRTQRKYSITNNFCLAPEAEIKMVGKRLLVIDDVFTTGSTLYTCLEPLSTIPNVKLGVCTIAIATS